MRPPADPTPICPLANPPPPNPPPTCPPPNPPPIWAPPPPPPPPRPPPPPPPPPCPAASAFVATAVLSVRAARRIVVLRAIDFCLKFCVTCMTFAFQSLGWNVSVPELLTNLQIKKFLLHSLLNEIQEWIVVMG